VVILLQGGTDVIVIGAGHNGLTCAAYLAKAGLRVLVLEQYREIGGMTISEDITATGCLSDIHASGYLVAKLSLAPEELRLHEHGLDLITPDPNWAAVTADGRVTCIHRDPKATYSDLASMSEHDANVWTTLYERYLRNKPTVVAEMNRAPLSLDEFAEQVRSANGSEAYRDSLLSVRRWCEEHFESPDVWAFFASFACHGAFAPDDAGGGNFTWLFASVVQDVGCSTVRAGMHSVARALAAVLQAHGGSIRTNARVDRIIIRNGKATGVRLSTGETIKADLVVSNVDPRHLVLGFLGREAVGSQIANKMDRYEWGDSFFTIYALTDSRITFSAGEKINHASYVHAQPRSINDLTELFGQVRSGLLPRSPMLGLVNESTVDPSRATNGRSLWKIVVHFVPYEIRGDGTGKVALPDSRELISWDYVRDSYAEYIISLLDRNFLPGFRAHLLVWRAQSPLDLERRLPSAVHGTHQHGAPRPYQIGAMRPIPELAHYRTPIAGIYLCGAGSHPGSGVTLAPGRNAAQIICSDLKIAFPGGS